jgi:ABC-2 type transport system permease protein
MNFVIFPMFFMSSALYPLWKIRESSDILYWICHYNPFTYGVELIRFALYQQLNLPALWVMVLATVITSSVALLTFRGHKHK